MEILAKEQKIGFSLALVVVLIWSMNIALTRYSIDHISPVSISFYRWMIAFFLITPFIFQKVWRIWPSIKAHLSKLVVLSALGMAITQGLAYTAAQHTTATNMGVINAFVPIMTIFVSYLILGELPSKYAIWGGSLSILGLFYIISQGNIEQLFLKQGSWTGDTLMFTSISFYAVYCVLLKKWKIDIPLTISLYIQIFLAMFYHIPFILLLGLDPIDKNNVVLVMYAGIFTSAIAPLLWVKAINLIGPTQTSAVMNFMPVFTALIATFWLSEQWMLYHYLGGIVVLTGTLMAQRKSKVVINI